MPTLKKTSRCPSGGIGRHRRLKISRSQDRSGSSPLSGTTLLPLAIFQPSDFNKYPLFRQAHINNRPAISRINDYASVTIICTAELASFSPRAAKFAATLRAISI